MSHTCQLGSARSSAAKHICCLSLADRSYELLTGHGHAEQYAQSMRLGCSASDELQASAISPAYACICVTPSMPQLYMQPVIAAKQDSHIPRVALTLDTEW